MSGGFACWYGTCQYTSTRMITRGKREFTYGRIEARMALPMGQGLWPAFWMLGTNIGTVGWPASGEIDVMEHINVEPRTYGTIHWDAAGHASYGGSTAVADPTAFHVYAIEWTPASIKWFVDGAQFHEANIQNNINSTEEFHRPFFVLLNLAVGGNWPGSPNASTVFPARLSVDYVRVYQQGAVISPSAWYLVQNQNSSDVRRPGQLGNRQRDPRRSSGPATPTSTSSGSSVPPMAATTTSSRALLRSWPGT